MSINSVLDGLRDRRLAVMSSAGFAKPHLFITQINKTAPSDLWADFTDVRMHPL